MDSIFARVLARLYNMVMQMWLVSKVDQQL